MFMLCTVVAETPYTLAAWLLHVVTFTGIERIGSVCTRAVSALRNVRSQAEQRLNFSPYEATKRSKPLLFKFYCLPTCDSARVPTSSVVKITLTQSGLGLKELMMSPSLTARELRERIVEAFPLLSKGGGFEFLRCVPNTRDLEAIPYNFTVSPQHLKSYMGKGKVYIRPLQADLDTALPADNSTEIDVCMQLKGIHNIYLFSLAL